MVIGADGTAGDGQPDEQGQRVGATGKHNGLQVRQMTGQGIGLGGVEPAGTIAYWQVQICMTMGTGAAE